MNKEWRQIPWAQNYWISSTGAVKRNGREMKLQTCRKGYYRVKLTVEGVFYFRKIHALVAECFIGPRPEGLHVCHIDGNRLNNNIENLKYGTALDNAYDMMRHGTQHSGLRVWSCKLSDSDVDYIRANYRRPSYHVSNKLELAAKFNVSKETIMAVVCKKRSRFGWNKRVNDFIRGESNAN